MKQKQSLSELCMFPDLTKPFSMQTDASNKALRFVLAQEKDVITSVRQEKLWLILMPIAKLTGL